MFFLLLFFFFLSSWMVVRKVDWQDPENMVMDVDGVLFLRSMVGSGKEKEKEKKEKEKNATHMASTWGASNLWSSGPAPFLSCSRGYAPSSGRQLSPGTKFLCEAVLRIPCAAASQLTIFFQERWSIYYLPAAPRELPVRKSSCSPPSFGERWFLSWLGS